MNERLERAIETDSLIRLFGIEVEEATEELSRVSVVVRDDFLQLHGLAHGGLVFTLLDVAFSLTVNARVDAVAVQWSISQFRSAKLGDKITAECRPLHLGRRLMVVDLVAIGPEGKVLAKGQATAIPIGETVQTKRVC